MPHHSLLMCHSHACITSRGPTARHGMTQSDVLGLGEIDPLMRQSLAMFQATSHHVTQHLAIRYVTPHHS